MSVTWRYDLRRVLDAAIAATQGERLLSAYGSATDQVWSYREGRRHFSVPLPQRASGGRIIVVGAGKAAAALAKGLETSLDGRLDGGQVIVKFGHGTSLRRVVVSEAAHPVPDQAGATATAQIMARLQATGPNDLVFVLLSGGASSLLVAPAAELTLADKSLTHAALVRSGAVIDEINTVRKHLSSIKGGRLAELAGAATLATLVISDVVGDDLATIGSGPTVADPTTFADSLAVIDRYALRESIPPRALEHLLRGAAGARSETPKQLRAPGRRFGPWIIASNASALDSAATCATSLGYDVRRLAQPLTGNTHDVARAYAAEIRQLGARRERMGPVMLLAGGETTLTVRGSGRGGRCQELALVAAQQLADLSSFCLLAAGTDGTDGPTDAAGAYVDASTLARAQAIGLRPEETLRDNNSYEFFDRLGDHCRTGPTGTNVMDVLAAIVP